jgi:RNA-binding protein 25
VSGVERERERERQQVEGEERLAATTRERLAAWDDEKEAEKKRDLYYIDR